MTLGDKHDLKQDLKPHLLSVLCAMLCSRVPIFYLSALHGVLDSLHICSYINTCLKTA